MLKRFDANQYIDDIDYDKIAIWIQFHFLSSDLISGNNGGILGSKVGDVLEVEPTRFMYGIWKSLLIVRIEVEVRKPFVRGFWVWNLVNQLICVDLKYEKLGDFCFRYGYIDHIDRFCQLDKKMLVIRIVGLS